MLGLSGFTLFTVADTDDEFEVVVDFYMDQEKVGSAAKTVVP